VQTPFQSATFITVPKPAKKTPFERFRRLAQRIVAVPKREVDELRLKAKKRP
jgi:hypothetical protein